MKVMSMPIGSGSFYQTIYYASRVSKNPCIVLRFKDSYDEKELLGVLKSRKCKNTDIKLHLISFKDYLNGNIPKECDSIFIYELDRLLEQISKLPTTIVYNN